MKKLTSYIVIVIFAFTFNTNAKAQSSACSMFHRDNCHIEGEKEEVQFIYNSQSKSGLFEQGSTCKLRCVVYKGMDYRIIVCAETDILGNDIQFRILDAKTKEELFDNTKQDNVKQMDFSSSSTRQLIIEVTVPSGESKDAKGKNSDAACVGLLIEHRISEKLGLSHF